MRDFLPIVGLALALAGCQTILPSPIVGGLTPAQIADLEAKVQQIAAMVCPYQPTVAEINSIIGQFDPALLLAADGANVVEAAACKLATKRMRR
jgi:hypothetical protein